MKAQCPPVSQKGERFLGGGVGEMLMCLERLVASLAWARSMSAVWRVSSETHISCNHSPKDNNNFQNVTTNQVKTPGPLGT